MKEDIRNVQKMERKWKEGTSDHAGGSLKWNDDDLLLCGDGPGCKLDERRCDKRRTFYGSDHEGAGCVPKRLCFCDCGGSGTFCAVVYLCRRKTVIW